MLSPQILEKCRQMEQVLMPFVFEKRHIIQLLQITLLMRGHVLIEDLPGVGKTTLAKAFSRVLGRSFSRIQGTSDTLPQDILGGEIIDFRTKEFKVKKGPIFEEIVLIDEINRMHPKTQSAFLEAMQEKQVSLNGGFYPLPDVHLVLATQNPLELSGTFILPEAQRDRFACMVSIGFPDQEVQKQILVDQSHLYLDEDINNLEQVLDASEILEAQEALKKVVISDEILDRLIHLAHWTRNIHEFRYGISPRGLALFSSALRSKALLEGRDYVIPEDGIDLIVPFIRHRVGYLDESIAQDQLGQLLTEKYNELCSGL